MTIVAVCVGCYSQDAFFQFSFVALYQFKIKAFFFFLPFRVCTGLTEAAYQLLTAEVYAEWVCDKCLSSKNIPLVKFKP